MKTILKLLLFIFILAVLGFGITVFGVAYLNKKINEPFKTTAKEQIFEVKQGEGAKKIAKGLRDAGVIENENYFLFYLWESGDASKLKAGRYSISAMQSIVSIAEKFISGDVFKNEIWVTIPEGFNFKEIENRLAEKGVVESSANNLLISKNTLDMDFYKQYDFLKCDNNKYLCVFEGYLFPDTYKFEADNFPINEDDVIEKMLSNFQDRTKDLQKEALQKGKDFRNIVIMASILEKEVRTLEDMKIVSGLLWKRIFIGMPLQVDATIAYLTGKKTGEITYGDLKQDSPYNTYLHKGLPPAPISNPGIVALEAALNPIENDYLYYLSKPTGETVFSKTIEEHNRAKNMYLK